MAYEIGIVASDAYQEEQRAKNAAARSLVDLMALNPAPWLANPDIRADAMRMQTEAHQWPTSANILPSGKAGDVFIATGAASLGCFTSNSIRDTFNMPGAPKPPQPKSPEDEAFNEIFSRVRAMRACEETARMIFDAGRDAAPKKLTMEIGHAADRVRLLAIEAKLEAMKPGEQPYTRRDWAIEQRGEMRMWERMRKAIAGEE